MALAPLLALILGMAALASCGDSDSSESEANDSGSRESASEDRSSEVGTDDAKTDSASAEDESSGDLGEDETADRSAKAGDDDTVEDSDDELAFPDEEWETIEPEDAGIDPAGLEEMEAAAKEIGSNCVAVTRNGKLVYSKVFDDRTPDQQIEIFSATKSFTSAAVGIAQDRGMLDIDDKASDYIVEWQGTDSEDVTIRNLLSNDSGRFWEFEVDFGDLVLAEDQTGFAIDLEQETEIGEEWVYNNSAIQTLEGVLEAATGTTEVDEWATEALLEPIGMNNSTWTTDPSGNARAFMGISSTCEDMARFGLLFLAGGNWDGEQVISTDYVNESVQASQDLNPGYGFLWWRNVPDEETGELRWEGASGDTYAALGAGGQVIVVQPDNGVVYTRMGSVNATNSDGAITVITPILAEAIGDLPDTVIP